MRERAAGRQRKKLLFIMAGVLAFGSASWVHAPKAGAAGDPTLTVNANVDKGEVGTIFGSNHRYIYGGFGSWNSSTNSLDSKLIDEVKNSGINMLRFPGGTVANKYKWQRGIGPHEDRPRNVHGKTGEPTSNDYGPDEYGQMLEQIGAEGDIVVDASGWSGGECLAKVNPNGPSEWSNLEWSSSNCLSGAQEAAAFVAYMNGQPGDSNVVIGGINWAELRVNNGHAEPYKIKYWEVGNEMDQGGGQEEWLAYADLEHKYLWGDDPAPVSGTIHNSVFNRQPVVGFSDFRSRASTASANLEYQVKGSLAEVKVNGQTWAQVANFNSSGPASLHYVYSVVDAAAGTYRITFGNNSKGLTPLPGDEISVTYTNPQFQPDVFNALENAYYARYAPISTAAGTYKVEVGSETWTQVATLANSLPADKHYTINFNTGKITFGNNIKGKRPESNVYVTYRTANHDGFVDFYKAMKAVDPSIKVFSVFGGITPDLVAENSQNYFDGIIIHPYGQGVSLPNVPRGEEFAKNFHDAIMGKPASMESWFTGPYNTFNSLLGPNHGKQIMVSEYGIAGWVPIPNATDGAAHYLRTLDQGLYVGKQLLSFMKVNVTLASKHTLLDFDPATAPPGSTSISAADNAMFNPKEDQFIPTATALTMQLFSNMTGSRKVETVRSNLSQSYFTAGATKDEAGNLYVTVVNDSRENSVQTTINLAGFTGNGSAEVWTLNSTNPNNPLAFLDYNEYDHVAGQPINRVAINKQTGVSVGANSFTHTFPAHSITAIQLTPAPVVPADPSLKGHWKFDETSGTAAADISGNNFTGTLVNGSAWTTAGKTQGAVLLDGADDFVQLPNIVNPGTTSFTAAAWVKLDAAVGQTQTILQQEGANGRGWLYRKADGKLASFIGGVATVSTGTIPADGSWHHAALTYDVGTLKLYLDGQLEAAASRTAVSSTDVMRIGRHKTPDSNNEEWDGAVDNLRIYNRALSGIELNSLFVAGI
ncbi:LamG-like jellyroll fold domain-containing protein [Paenibacillus pasadenensis]|uniref:LamG-like jellyroll fold domain-containing protein n=1 Tax=Paenibacillus pasadenensis TaxID=217090 RepID=UPI0020410D4D|nr:LamG-like jellyroll fold domain-containing protein [Paenibacillus pasadenensis]